MYQACDIDSAKPAHKIGGGSRDNTSTRFFSVCERCRPRHGHALKRVPVVVAHRTRKYELIGQEYWRMVEEIIPIRAHGQGGLRGEPAEQYENSVRYSEYFHNSVSGMV
jgi:hypothetical protein